MAPRDTHSIPQTAPAAHIHADTDELHPQKAHCPPADAAETLQAPMAETWDPRVAICMYCSTVIGSEPTGAYCLLHEPSTATHGACKRCYRRFCHQLKRGVANPLAPLVKLRRQHIFGVPFDPYQQTSSQRDGSPSGSAL